MPLPSPAGLRHAVAAPAADLEFSLGRGAAVCVSSDRVSNLRRPGAIGAGLIFGLIGAGIDAAFDNANDGRQVIYTAPNGGPNVSMKILGRGRGLGVTLRW